MAYSGSSKPILTSVGPLTGAGKQWLLTGADPIATVDTSGYITDGGNYGMKVGDMVTYYDTNLKIVYSLRVHTVSATAPGAVDLSDSTIIGVTGNTD